MNLNLLKSMKSKERPGRVHVFFVILPESRSVHVKRQNSPLKRGDTEGCSLTIEKSNKYLQN